MNKFKVDIRGRFLAIKKLMFWKKAFVLEQLRKKVISYKKELLLFVICSSTVARSFQGL